MSTFLNALTSSLPEIIRISALTDCFARIGVVAYRDYCDGKLLLEWSGWCYPSPTAQLPANCGSEPSDASNKNPSAKRATQAQLLEFVKFLRPYGGGDYPEATKTGLAMAHEVMRAEATTIMMLYTDAPPHFEKTGGMERQGEIKALTKESYGGFGKQFADWVTAAKTLTGEGGGKKAHVYSILAGSTNAIVGPYTYLSTVTHGLSFGLSVHSKTLISELTIGILLAWMGVDTSGVTSKYKVSVKTFTQPHTLTKLQKEKELEGRVLFHSFDTSLKMAKGFEIEAEDLELANLSRVVPSRANRIVDFSKRYNSDTAYKDFVATQLRDIITENVTAMTVNPIFGTLWRAVCNDRKNPARDGLIQLFGAQVDKLTTVNDAKAKMKAWLEESYNFAEEIENMIAEVPEQDKFPCVYLDPTQDFTVKDGPDSGDDNKPLNKFTRNELLEIGRSCDYRILRRLGKVLTRLSHVEKSEDLPLHIRTAGQDLVPRIPLALSKEEHKREFWRVLLHVVLPGTILARRPAALLAALALRMGIQTLRDVADEELIGYRDSWNTLEIPETWNIGCLGLLLDADNDYAQRIKEGTTKAKDEVGTILTAKDKALFKVLVDHKMLELNLNTTLTARIGWSPRKDKAPLGPVTICRKCQFPRSVTIMGPKNICGMCSCGTFCKCKVCQKADDHDFRLSNLVSQDDSENTKVTWVECVMRECRAQYVVYNPQALNVRAKCFYCRHPNDYKCGDAPVVDCTKCLNRMVYPEEYRPKDFDASVWQCPHCVGGMSTVVDADTTAQALMEENGSDWLLTNRDRALWDPLRVRTVFYTATHCDLENLAQKVEILPNSSVELKLRGKLVQNMDEVKDSLRKWVLSRRTEATQCSLCFATVAKSAIHPACGRKGCHQLVCIDCRKGWYGLNAPGRILNIAALSCPFCRRIPAPSIVTSFGLTRLGHAQEAIKNSGEWIYGWCRSCGFAKQYIERVCAQAAPAELQNWFCADCQALQEAATQRLLNVERPPTVCPSCGVMTEKMFGCDHITCPCGAHWCYACGVEATEETIYDHINKEHETLWYEDEDLY